MQLDCDSHVERKKNPISVLPILRFFFFFFKYVQEHVGVVRLDR